MSDDELERRLTDLADRLDVPAAPNLRNRVANVLEVAEMRHREPRPRSRLAIPVLALIAGVGAVLATPVVADWLGIGGVEVRQEPAPPEVRRLGAPLDVGRPVSAAEAARIAGHALVRPTRLGEPDETWVDTAPGVPVVTFVYRPSSALPATAEESSVGALFSQVDASIAEQRLWTKFADDGTSVAEVQVSGMRGLWIEGSHYVALRDRRGNVIAERVRLAANVLLWERAGLTLRLETALDRDAALRIAESVR